MPVLKVTLNRAHKIAERIAARISELGTVVSDEAFSASFSGAPTAAQKEKLERGYAEFKRAGELALEYLRELGGVRQTIAAANLEHGVSAKLTQIEMNRRAISVLSRLEQRASVPFNQVPLQDVGGIAFQTTISGQPLAVVVTAVAAGAGAEYEARRRELERQNFVLHDELAELNAAKVSLDLSEPLARDIGLMALDEQGAV